MTKGRGRGSRPFRKPAKKASPHLKDKRREAVSGREEQALGSGGRPGGTKSSGGHPLSGKRAHSGRKAPSGGRVRQKPR